MPQQPAPPMILNDQRYSITIHGLTQQMVQELEIFAMYLYEDRLIVSPDRNTVILFAIENLKNTIKADIARDMEAGG